MPEPPDHSIVSTPAAGQHSLDNPDELFDLVDLDDNVIGQVRRGEAHSNPTLIHRSVQILVFASDGRLLLQRRSMTKDLFPGYYCASASGHVASGEDYLATAERELVEELGISTPLIFLGKTLVKSAPETEITSLYLARSDGPFQFHPTETAGGTFMTLDDVQRGMRSDALAVTPALRSAIEQLSQYTGRSEGGLPALLAKLG